MAFCPLAQWLSPTSSVTFHHSGWKSTPVERLPDSGSTQLPSGWPSLGDSVGSLEKGQGDCYELMPACRGEPLHTECQWFLALGEKDGVPRSGGPILSPSLHCLLSGIYSVVFFCLLTLTGPGSSRAGSGLWVPKEQASPEPQAGHLPLEITPIFG